MARLRSTVSMTVTTLEVHRLMAANTAARPLPCQLHPPSPITPPPKAPRTDGLSLAPPLWHQTGASHLQDQPGGLVWGEWASVEDEGNLVVPGPAGGNPVDDQQSTYGHPQPELFDALQGLVGRR